MASPSLHRRPPHVARLLVEEGKEGDRVLGRGLDGHRADRGRVVGVGLDSGASEVSDTRGDSVGESGAVGNSSSNRVQPSCLL